MLYAGLDLHKKFSYVTVMDEQGKIVSQVKLPNNQDSITEYIESIGDELKELAMEAGPSWYWLYELLDSLDINVHLAHPKRVKAIASARVKTDKIDSTVLGHLLRTNLLPEAYIPDRETWLQRELLRHRASLVRLQTILKNKCHSILSKLNVQHDFSDLFGKAGLEFLKALELPEVFRLALDNYLSILSVVRERIKEITKEIDLRAKTNPQALRLASIPGIGYYSAMLILSEVGDISRFQSAKHLSSYAGLAPRVRSSGQRTFTGHITREGSPWLRWIMVEAAIHASNQSGPLGDYYHSQKARKGPKVARVACARKLLKHIYHMFSKNDKNPIKPFDRVGASS